MLFTSPGEIEEQINYMFWMSHLPLTICLSNFLAIVFHKVLQSTKKLYFSLFVKWCCLIFSSHLWKIQVSKSWYKQMHLFLLMESTMKSSPKPEHCKSAWGAWRFWKIEAWLDIADSVDNRKTISESSGKKAVLSQRLLHVWTVSSQLTISPYFPPQFLSPSSLAQFRLFSFNCCYNSMKSNLIMFSTLGVLLTSPKYSVQFCS